MLELYHNSMSTCSQKVRIALAEKGQDWEGHHLNLRARDQHKPEYMKLNPNGVVPTIVHDGRVVIESAVINEYIDDVFGGTPLRPDNAYDRARMRMWTKQLDEGLHAASATISACIAFRYQFMDGKTDEQIRETLNGYIDPAKRARMSENVLDGVKSSFFLAGIRRVRKMLDDMDARLKTDAWLAGETYSLADIAVTPYVTRVDHLQLGGQIKARPALADWYDRIRARPSYDAALTKFFLPDFVSLMAEKGAIHREEVEDIMAGA
jgi:glutathione S-transferase